MICPICSTRNNYFEKRCRKCGIVLTLEEAEEKTTIENKRIPVFLPESDD